MTAIVGSFFFASSGAAASSLWSWTSETPAAAAEAAYIVTATAGDTSASAMCIVFSSKIFSCCYYTGPIGPAQAPPGDTGRKKSPRGCVKQYKSQGANLWKTTEKTKIARLSGEKSKRGVE